MCSTLLFLLDLPGLFHTLGHRVWNLKLLNIGYGLSICLCHFCRLELPEQMAWKFWRIRLGHCLKSLWNMLLNYCSGKVGSVWKKTWETRVQPFFAHSTRIAFYAFLLTPPSFKQFLISFFLIFYYNSVFFPFSLLNHKFNFETFILPSELRGWVK